MGLVKKTVLAGRLAQVHLARDDGCNHELDPLPEYVLAKGGAHALFEQMAGSIHRQADEIRYLLQGDGLLDLGIQKLGNLRQAFVPYRPQRWVERRKKRLDNRTGKGNHRIVLQGLRPLSQQVGKAGRSEERRHNFVFPIAEPGLNGLSQWTFDLDKVDQHAGTRRLADVADIAVDDMAGNVVQRFAIQGTGIRSFKTDGYFITMVVVLVDHGIMRNETDHFGVID